jgi:hypothetical protein
MKSILKLCCLAFVAGLVLAGEGSAQGLPAEALRTFSSDTIRVEYANTSKLRTLPNYDSLRQKFVGPRLRELEESFSTLGVKETDINEVILGWRPGTSVMELSGLVTGRFTAKQIAERAAANNVATMVVSNSQAYCAGSGAAASCLVVLRDALGLFGSDSALTQMLEVRDGSSVGLASDSPFAQFMGDPAAQSPIWGVAVGVAVPDFFRAWIPQGNIQLDWAKAFQQVESLVYTVDTSENVKLDVKMDCTNDQSAESTRQIFEGLRMVQQMAWQNTNPGRANPFQSLQIARDGRRLSLKMASSYADLQGLNPVGGGF